eukprot:253689_1
MYFILNSLLFITYAYSQSIDQQWSIDISSSGASNFTFWWNRCVGSGHAALALRADWQRTLKYVHDETGMESVRFHGILNDDVGTYNGVGDYSFINIDKIFDFLLSINMKPYIEVSFTPNELAVGKCYMDHYKSNTTPPKDYNEWQKYISTWIQHLVDRYGIDTVSKWHFEIWNEPNIPFLMNWNGTCIPSTFDEYLTLYNNTVTAIKSVSDKVQVGGPATAGIEAWVDQFLTATSTKNIPIDFVSSHEYPPQGNNKSINTNIFLNSLRGINGLLDKYNSTYPNMPFYLSEFNSGLFWINKDQTVKAFDNQDTIYASSFMIFQMNKLQQLFGIHNRHYKLLSYWTFSDIFEEGGFQSYPFWPNYTYSVGADYYFGMTTIRGINKPVFNVFQIVYKYGSTTQYNAQIIGADKNANNNTIAVFCLKNDKNNSQNRYSLFMTNYADYPYPIDLFRNQTIFVYVLQTIDNSLKVPKSATEYRIDESNGNAYQTWIKIGKPKYPTQQQMSILNESSQMKGKNVSWKVVNDTTVQFNVYIPKYTVILIDIQY